MSGAGFILAINVTVAGALAVAFAAVALYEKGYVSARWFALGYFMGLAYAVIEFTVPIWGNPFPATILAYAAFVAVVAALNVGLANMYAVRIPWRLIVFIAFAGIAARWFLVEALPRSSFFGQVINQAPFFLMQFVGATIVLCSATRRKADIALALLLIASALQFLSKPVLSFAFGGTGSDAQHYLSTVYAMISQTMGTVFAISVALFILILLVHDLLMQTRTRSETDVLSGALNRRGFEVRFQALLDKRLANCLPLALIVCDLDHFKSINDTYGHSTGDCVIAAFASTLLDAAREDHIVARTGGEEFAVVLPGSNLVTARLFAEQVRSAFAIGTTPGLPAINRVSASFGIAELSAEETWPDLLRRADLALYEAKHAGRDCVKLAHCPDGQTVALSNVAHATSNSRAGLLH